MPQVTVLHDEHKKFVRKLAAVLAAVGVVAVAGLAILVNLVWAGQHTEALKNAKSLDARGKYADELQYLQHYVATNPPKQYKFDALVAEGKAAEKAGQYRTAFAAYVAADLLSAKPNLDLKLDVAQAASEIGDKATAISYYRQALALTPKSDSDHAFEYQDQIRGLGGTP